MDVTGSALQDGCGVLPADKHELPGKYRLPGRWEERWIPERQAEKCFPFSVPPANSKNF